MTIYFGPWDVVFLLAVPVQATSIAYLHAPRAKALVYSLPIPFSLATLAVGAGIDATNVVGMILTLGYTHAVNQLYNRLRVPIVLSIVLSGLAYGLAGWALAPVLPKTDAMYWGSLAAAFVIALVLFLTTPHRPEPGHRSPLPVWVKFLCIFVVIAGLVVVKSALQGFVTMFPMVGLIAAYEARTCLRTICRQVPVLMLGMIPMLAILRLAQGPLGLPPALLLGWAAYLSVLIPLMYTQWRTDLAATVENNGDPAR